MRRRDASLVPTREEADRRIRRTARAASVLCGVVAALALALAAWSLFAAAWLTRAAAGARGTDLVTAFLTTSEASGDFALAETGARDPVYSYDDQGDVTGSSQVLGGTVSLRGNPLSSVARGVVGGALTGAAFALAARMCGRVRRTGEVFSPERACELGRVGVLTLLAGLLPGVLLAVGQAVANAVVGSLVAQGQVVGYALVPALRAQDVTLAAVGLLLVAVARMFEYGCILQKQDDELL